MEKGSEGWTEGKFNANSTSGAPGRTVGQLYGGQKVRHLSIYALLLFCMGCMPAIGLSSC